MPEKEATQRVMDVERGVAGSPGQIYAAVTASGPAVTASPPPTELTVIGNALLLSAQAPTALISLRWRPPLTAQAVRLYQVQIATDSTFTTGISYVQASDTSVSIPVTTSAAGIAYWFRVRVFSGNIVSDWSASVTATSAADATPAGQPTGLAWDWTGGDLILTWTNPSSTNMKDVEVRIWESVSKTVLYHTGYSATGRYVWTLPQQRIDTSGTLDPAVYFELRSRTWSNTLGTPTVPGTQPTNAVPSAPASVSLISSIGSLTISVTATSPTDFQAYRYRIIQTLPSASDVLFDSPSALETYSLYAQATYQVGVKILDVYGQLSSETLSSTSVIDTLTIGSLRADVIYSDADGNSDATLHVKLSDTVLASGGQTYATSGTWNKWTRAERPMLDRYRVITLSMTPASGTSTWYLRLSSDGTNWTYYAGPVTSSRILTLVANAAAAQAAAVSAATLGGSSTSKVELPATVEARYIEVWIRNAGPANTRLDEFYPRRLVEADDIYVQNLSSISANIGTINAGTINGVTINSTTINSSTINAGAGNVTIDATGIKLLVGAYPGLTPPPYALNFMTGTTLSSVIGAWVNGGSTIYGTVLSQKSPGGVKGTQVELWAEESSSGAGDFANITLQGGNSGGGSRSRIDLVTDTVDLLLYNSIFTVTAPNTVLSGALKAAALNVVNGSSDSAIEVGAGGSGSRNAYIDFVGDTTYTDYGLRVIRGNAGANADSTILHRGTGSLLLTVNDAGAIALSTNSTQRMQIDSSGYVGIGVAAVATHRLTVQGATSASTNYALVVRNNAGGNILYCRDDGLSNFISSAWSSDARHKEQIRAIDDSDLARFRQLEPKHYIRTNGPGGPEYGLIAQDTRPIFPEFIVEDSDGFLSLRYNDAIPLLMAEVRLLRARLDLLEAA